jgi:hypothetical protein
LQFSFCYNLKNMRTHFVWHLNMLSCDHRFWNVTLYPHVSIFRNKKTIMQTTLMDVAYTHPFIITYYI